jgi:uncharacterized membrane protein
MHEMTTNRLEAFSDGVIAIIITIMVLELRAPAQPTFAALVNLAPEFLTYTLSFLGAAIMWSKPSSLRPRRANGDGAASVVESLPALLDVGSSHS